MGFADIISSIGGYIKDRLFNPLYVTFVTAWVAFNYRLLMTIFGGGNWSQKIPYIDNVLYPTFNTSVLKGIIYPGCASILFIIVNPFASRWIWMFIRTVEKTTAKKLNDIENETPLTVAQAQRLRENYAKSARELKAKISELQEQLDASQAEANRLEALLSTQKANLTHSSSPSNRPEDHEVFYPAQNQNSRRTEDELQKDLIERTALELSTEQKRLIMITGSRTDYTAELLSKEFKTPLFRIEHMIHLLEKAGFIFKQQGELRLSPVGVALANRLYEEASQRAQSNVHGN